MAYGVKYRLDYCNSSSDNFRLDIEINGYSGSIFNIESTGEPFVLAQLNSNQYPKLETIRATEATLSIYKDDNFNIDALKTSDETHIRISHYLNGVLKWRGFALPEFFHQTIEQNPVITITATDRLGVLKNISFDNVYEDVSIIDVIRISLLKTGNPLNIKSVVGFQESGNIFANRPLSEVVSGERLFKQGGDALNCFDVIKTTLDAFNCYITQDNGYWWIVNKEQQETGQGMVVEYGPNIGSIEIISETPFNRDTVNFDYVFTGGEEMIRPVLSEVGILGEFGGSKIYPQNNNFRIWNSGNPTSWTKVASSGASGPFNCSRFDGNVKNYLDNGDFVYDPGNIPKLKQGNSFLGPRDNTSNLNSYPYLESNPIPIILSNVIDNKVTIDYDFNITSKNKSVVSFCIVLETNRTDNKYYILNGSAGSFVKAGNDKRELFNHLNGAPGNVHYFYKMMEGSYGVIVSDVINNDVDDNAAISMSVKGSATIGSDIGDFTQSKLYVRIFGGSSYIQLSNIFDSLQVVINSVTIDIKSTKVHPKGNLYKLVRSGGTFTAKSEIATSVFSDYLTTGLNGYFYNYPSDDTSVIRPIGSTSWRTVGDNESLPLLRHSVRQISKLYGETQNELNISIESRDISPISLFNILCKSELYTVSKYTINYLTSVVSLVLSQIKRPVLSGTEYIYSYFGNEGGTTVSGINTIGGGGGGGGSSRQDLQTTTEIGNTTTLDIITKGTRNIDFLEVPGKAPVSGDMLPSRWYMYVDVDAPSGSDPEPGADFYIKTAKDANLSGIADGQVIAWSVAQGKFVPASFPSLSGYATQSWVLSQDYASKSWVQGRGYAMADGSNASGVWPISINGSAKEWAGNVYSGYIPDTPDAFMVLKNNQWGYGSQLGARQYLGADVNPTANSIVQRDGNGYVYANYISLPLTKEGFNPAQINGIIGFNNINGDSYAYQFSKQAVNQFLGMPPNGDTWDSVLARGADTLRDIGVRAKVKLKGTADATHYIWNNPNTDYDEINVSTGFKIIGYPNTELLRVNGSGIVSTVKITCPVIESQYIIPTAPPSNMEAGKWYLTVRTT